MRHHYQHVDSCRHQCKDGKFEDSEGWLEGIENVIVSLGRRVLGFAGAAGMQFGNGVSSSSTSLSNGDGSIASFSSYCAFPAEFLLGELEDISAALSSTGHPVGKGWAGRVFLQLNLPHASILVLYMRMLEDATGWQPERIIQLLSSIVLILFRWTEIVYE